MAKRLCIGGAGDGRWIDHDTEPTMVVPEEIGLPRPPFDRPVAVGELTHSLYRPMRLEFGGHLVVVLVEADLKPADVLIRLIEGYRGKRS